jgi:gliding motility-associated-like protein
MTINQLVQNVLVGSPSVYTNNITYTGATTARGTFNCAGACGVGIPNGVMISTGKLSNAVGPNNQTGAGTGNGTAGDADLNTLAPGSTAPQDAAVIQFDFMVPNDSIQFKYVWGSEEYSDYVNSNCNDVFGFFVNGPNIVGKKNIALIPNTNTPISINNVNNGQAPGGTSPSGPCNNCQYFRDNTGDPSIQYDGLTTVLTAKAAVCPCEVYHLKIATQDFCDGAFDSGVFLEGGSFQPSGQIPVLNVNGVELASTDTIFICPGDSFPLTLPTCRNPVWSNGDTNMVLWVSQPGSYYGTISNFIGAQFCFAFSSIINVAFSTPNPVITLTGNNNLCPDDSVILTSTAGNSYLWSNGATTQSIVVHTAGTYSCTITNSGSCSATTPPVTITTSGTPAIITPTSATTFCQGGSVTLNATAAPNYTWSTGATSNSINVNTSGTYTLTVTDNGCISDTTVTVTVNALPTPAITGPAAACSGQPLSLDAGVYSSYSWSSGQTTATINVTATGTYTVTVTDANGCTGSDSQVATINTNPTPSISGTLQFCSGLSTTLSAPAGFSSYLWNGGTTSASLSVSAGGNYTVTVTDANGCTGTTSASVTMNNLPTPAISGLTAICNGAATTLTATPAGANYVWNTGSTSNSISASTAGTYTVTVTDGNGCTAQTTHSLSLTTNPTPTITGTTSACQSQPAIIDAGSYSSYVWSTGATTQTINASSSGNYTVTVTDANGCTGSDLIAVTINALPTPSITGTLQFCSGNNTTINAGNGYSSYLWDNGSVSASLNVSAAGTFTVTVTDGNGCTGSTSATVVMNNLPSPAISGLAAICTGASTTLTATPAGANYVWSTGSTSSTISASSAGTYTVTVTDANGCSAQTTHSLTLNTLPTPVITGTTTACQTQPAFIDAGAYSSYSWSTGATTQVINATSTGTYVVVVTDANGCTGSNFINVTIFTNPTPTITGTLQFCTGKTTTLTGDPGYTTYNWSNGSTSSSINVTAGGIYDLTVTDGNGCDGTTNVTVIENSLPTVTITGPTDFCDGNTVQIQTAQPASGYVWSDGSTNAQFTVTQTGTYTVTVTDNNGCTNNNSYTVTEHLNPVVTITGTDTVCSGFSGLLDAGTGMSSYLWSDGSTTSTIAPTSTTFYTVTVTDNNGCTGSNSIQFVSLSLPVSIITGDTTICTGEVTGLQGPTGNYQYLWSSGATSDAITVSNGGVYTLTITDINGCKNDISTTVIENLLPVVGLSNTASICAGGSVTLNPGNFAIYSWNNGSSQNQLSTGVAGNYIVTVTDNNGCQNSDSTLVIVNALPTPSITGPAATCENSPIVLDGGTGYAIYQWSTGESVQQISTANGGAYTLTVTDNNGCSNSTSTTLVTHPLPNAEIAGKYHLCDGETTTLSAIAGQGTYLWSTGSTGTSITQNTTGTYALTITTSFGCVSKDTFKLAVHPIPTISYNYMQQANCEAILVQFVNASTYDIGSTFAWNFGDGTVGNEMNPDHSYSDSGYYATTLMIVSPWGCKASDSLTINLERPALPEAKFVQSSDVSSVFNSTIRFTNQSTNATHYKWNFGDGQTSEDPDPIHQFDRVGTNTVKLIAYNVAGCLDEYEMNVEIVPMYIPSGFTPNNDGKNDVWFDGTPVLNVKSFNMQVLDRWGGTIYTSDSFLRPWDGNFNTGKQAPVGVYTYYIQITSEKGKDYEFRGTFSLVR